MNAYVYRIDPAYPERILVRRRPSVAQRARAGRYGENWRLYMNTVSEARARQILAMLRRRKRAPVHVVQP